MCQLCAEREGEFCCDGEPKARTLIADLESAVTYLRFHGYDDLAQRLRAHRERLREEMERHCGDGPTSALGLSKAAMLERINGGPGGGRVLPDGRSAAMSMREGGVPDMWPTERDPPEEHMAGCGCPECEPDDECRCPHDGYHDGPDCFCHHLEGCPEAKHAP